MIEHFQKKRKSFERLCQMIKDDENLYYIDHDTTRPAEYFQINITDQRLAEYRSLLTILQLNSIVTNNVRDTITFNASTSGVLAIRASYKGYCYSELRLSPIVDDLDSISNEQNYLGYRKIEDNWYLYFLD